MASELGTAVAINCLPTSWCETVSDGASVNISRSVTGRALNGARLANGKERNCCQETTAMACKTTIDGG